ERVGISPLCDHENAPALGFLFERMVNGHLALRVHLLIVNVLDDANDPSWLLTEAHQLSDRVRPMELSVDGVLSWEQRVSNAAIDDHHPFGASGIRVSELTTGQNRNPQRREKSRRHRTPPCLRLVTRGRKRGSLRRHLHATRARVQASRTAADITPGDVAPDNDLHDTR